MKGIRLEYGERYAGDFWGNKGKWLVGKAFLFGKEGYEFGHLFK